MKNETETAVRSIVSIDAEVSRENLERALGISRDSFLRFTTQRRVVRNTPARRRSGEPAKTETTLRRARAFEPNNNERKHRR